MTYRTILAVLASEKDVEPLTTAATRLPGGRDIHLIGCHGEPSQFVVLSAPIDVPDVATLTALYEQADSRMKSVGDAFTAACTREGLSYEWRPVRSPGGDSATSALTTARTADITIVRQPDTAAEDVAVPNFESLLYDGGRPVLILPADGRIAEAVSRVVIAWDGSREASRAVQDALPFLKAAKDVEIVIVDAEKQPNLDAPEPGADLAASLSRHGVHATVTKLSRGSRSTAQVIEEQVVAANADLLVMGAYTHLKVREWLFGGVTRAFMDKVPVATLISR
jgi:Universal stress protein UspA and related nucleotide-binding proteins